MSRTPSQKLAKFLHKLAERHQGSVTSWTSPSTGISSDLIHTVHVLYTYNVSTKVQLTNVPSKVACTLKVRKYFRTYGSTFESTKVRKYESTKVQKVRRYESTTVVVRCTRVPSKIFYLLRYALFSYLISYCTCTCTVIRYTASYLRTKAQYSIKRRKKIRRYFRSSIRYTVVRVHVQYVGPRAI